jgi:hypothetical protein
MLAGQAPAQSLSLACSPELAGAWVLGCLGPGRINGQRCGLLARRDPATGLQPVEVESVSSNESTMIQHQTRQAAPMLENNGCVSVYLVAAWAGW